MRVFKSLLRQIPAGSPRRPVAAHAPMLMALEPRIMFDAALAATVAEVAQAAADPPADTPTSTQSDSDAAPVPRCH